MPCKKSNKIFIRVVKMYYINIGNSDRYPIISGLLIILFYFIRTNLNLFCLSKAGIAKPEYQKLEYDDKVVFDSFQQARNKPHELLFFEYCFPYSFIQLPCVIFKSCKATFKVKIFFFQESINKMPKFRFSAEFLQSSLVTKVFAFLAFREKCAIIEKTKKLYIGGLEIFSSTDIFL